MIADILMAFVIALFLEMFSLINKYVKQIAILVCCFALVFVYFVGGCQVDFVGTIDLAIWIMFVIMFDIVLMFTTKKIKKQIKE
jgi:hypothetical protein